MHATEAVPEAGEPFPRERQRLLVTVDADDGGFGARLEERLGVAAHPERAIDKNGPRHGEGRGQEADDAVAKHGNVPLFGGSP